MNKIITLPLMLGLIGSNLMANQLPADAKGGGGHEKHPMSVNNRLKRQSGRIANGVKSGKMNNGEAARTEARDARIGQRESADRAANGGQLTANERHHLEDRLNNNSRDIYKDKH